MKKITLETFHPACSKSNGFVFLWKRQTVVDQHATATAPSRFKGPRPVRERRLHVASSKLFNFYGKTSALLNFKRDTNVDRRRGRRFFMVKAAIKCNYKETGPEYYRRKLVGLEPPTIHDLERGIFFTVTFLHGENLGNKVDVTGHGCV